MTDPHSTLKGQFLPYLPMLCLTGMSAERFKQLAQDHTFSGGIPKQATELQSRHSGLVRRMLFGYALPFCLESFQEPREAWLSQ